MVYFDNAATSFPKPQSVSAEQTRCMRSYCGNPGRGSHRLAMAAAEKIYECREEAAVLFGVESPENIIFTMNTTMSLNMAIKGLLHRGDHVLISDLEHNAVYRPIAKLAEEGEISCDIFPSFVHNTSDRSGEICRSIEAMLRPSTRMLICTHASNICSAVMPIREIGALCKRYGILFVVDAAQSAGHLPIDLSQMQIDALCLPGHKGLLGPQGTGLLILREGLAADTLIEGGSGVNSLLSRMPEESPERYEAGTLPTPAIAGLCEGIKCVKRYGVEAIGAWERSLNMRLYKLLCEIPRVCLYAEEHVGSVLLFNLEGIAADRLGSELDREGFCVRSGFHCTALGHKTLGTPAGGAVRVSPGIYNTQAEIDAFAERVERIAQRI